MQLNQKIRYGVACLCELSKFPHEYLDTAYIANSQKLPLAYTHKVLQSLSRAGLIYSLKGTGYKLARPLSEISALEVMETLSQEADNFSRNPAMAGILEAEIKRALGNIRLDLVAAATHVIT